MARTTPPSSRRSAALYASYDLKRIYYAAFCPIPDASRLLPLESRAAAARAPALSGRLALSLLRFLAPMRSPRAWTAACSISMIDPKLAWALAKSRALPNRRQHGRARRAAAHSGAWLKNRRPDHRRPAASHASARRSCAPLRRNPPRAAFHYHGRPSPAAEHTSARLRAALAPPPQQLSLFA